MTICIPRNPITIKPRARFTNGWWEVRSPSVTNPCVGRSPELELAFERFMAATWHWFNGPDYQVQPCNGGW